MAGTLAPGSLGGYLGPQLAVTAAGGGGGVANWTGTRYFAVDFDGGSDAAAGFSDVSLAAAGAVAKKTWAGILAIIPPVGAGRIIVVGVKPRAAGASYGEAQTLQIYGYDRAIIRGTADFTNTAAERVQSAPQVPAGLNVPGYNITLSTFAVTAVTNATPIQITTGAAHGLASGDVVLNTGIGGITVANGDFHVDVIDATNFTLRNTRAPGQTYTAGGTVKVYRVTLAGGGAPALPAEPGVLGKRWRYSATTTTVALQNAATTVIRNGTDTIVFARDPTGGDPAAADIIFIEEPATAFTSVSIWSDARITSIVGFRYTTASVLFTGPSVEQSSNVAVAGVTYPNSEMNLSFMDVTPSTGIMAVNSSHNVNVTDTWPDETGTSVNSGSGTRAPFLAGNNAHFALVRNSCMFGTATDISSFVNCKDIVLAASCFNRSIDFIECRAQQNNFASATFAFGLGIGNTGSTTRRRLRMRGVTAHGGVLNFVASDAKIWGVFVEAMSVINGAVQVNGIGLNLQISELIGLGSDAGPGISLIDAVDTKVVLARNEVNSFGGSTGIEVRHAGPVDNTYANLNITNVPDIRGNDVQGTGGQRVPIGGAKLATNSSGVTLVLGNVVRSNGVTAQITRAFGDTLANASDVCGAMLTSPAAGALCYYANDGDLAVRADAAPTIGATPWLSGVNQAQMMTTAVLDGNFDMRLGSAVIEALVAGGVNYGIFAWNPDPEVLPTETLDLRLRPEQTLNGGGSVRVVQTVFNGGSFWVDKRVRFNRINVNFSAYTAGAPTTIKVLIYQAPQGTSGASATAARQAALIAAGSADPGGTGNFSFTVTEAVLEEGLAYVLYGRASAAGSATMRVFAISTVEGENTVIPANTHPLAFTTAVAASGANPAAIDTRDGVTLTASTVELCPEVRLIRV